MSCETVEKLIIQEKEKEVVSSLYRHQELKKAFIQFGSKFRLPDEIVFKLYKMIQDSIREDEGMVRLYHKNMLLYNTLSHTIKTFTEFVLVIVVIIAVDIILQQDVK